MRSSEEIIKQEDLNIQFFWDYNDELSEEQVLKIITEEEGLNDVESQIYDNNIDYISELENNKLKDILTDDFHPDINN